MKRYLFALILALAASPVFGQVTIPSGLTNTNSDPQDADLLLLGNASEVTGGGAMRAEKITLTTLATYFSANLIESTITGTEITSGGTDDTTLTITQTLNDSGAAGGSDVYRGIKLNLTETDTTGWDDVYLMDLQVGGTTAFNVTDGGRAWLQGSNDPMLTIYDSDAAANTKNWKLRNDNGILTVQILNDAGSAFVKDKVITFNNAGSVGIEGTLNVTGVTTLDITDVNGDALTSGGTDDYTLNITQTLNDAGAAGGSDVYRGIKLNLTETDVTGWDNVYLMDLQVGGASRFTVTDDGTVAINAPSGFSSDAINVKENGTQLVRMNNEGKLYFGNQTTDYGSIEGELNFDDAGYLLSADNGDMWLYFDGTGANFNLNSAGGTNPSVTMSGRNNDTIRLNIKGQSTQTSDLIKVTDNSDVNMFSVTAGGLTKYSVTAGITAATPGGQGDGALTRNINEVATVGTTDDAVTLPAAVAGLRVTIFNNGANQLEIWPASGDNAGAGVNTAVTLASGSNVTYVAYDATNWEAE